jgi:hypothetical protein
MGGQITRGTSENALHQRFFYDVPGKLYRFSVLLFQVLQFLPREKQLQITTGV